jgi:ubiquinone biosynthesis monooxygenase Coq6
VNAAFRLPWASVRFLHERLLDAAAATGAPLAPAQVLEDIASRERAHGIEPSSAFASATAPPNQGVAPYHADAVPPLVSSIQPGTVAGFPLRYQHADAYVGPRTVLVGDAAHTVHPLAGQGLNMGLADVEALTQCIQKAIMTGGDIGRPPFLLFPFTKGSR